ncbi:MinD/ParA family protein [Clostridium cylindrosporum]|uniref:Flagellum site-determining protein YlxH n=1 Tax=Clostridium cylindrosporum DSM 605 TaxID=1121307 RepID=A0A0J8G1T9_CLOCY|nr:MinD/ParA family protein [Clostridium cylindrosporum]KMT21716.1 flagellum site-determining protein YlxH [Clostridium cylindrosporum DSM 605]
MDQAAKLRELVETKAERNESFRVITVSSGKGGVGKSNFVVNLAVLLAEKGKRVAILDADFGMANIDILLGINSPYNIYDILENEKSMLDIIVETSEGIKVIPGGSGISKLANLSPDEESKIVKEFEKLSDIDILIIDTGAGVGRNVINFIKMADDVIIITNSEPTSITDAYGLIKVASSSTFEDKLSIIVNRTSDSKEANDTYNKLSTTSKKFLKINLNYLGYILEDHNVSMAVRKQESFVKLFPRSKATKCIDVISSRILGDSGSYKNSSVKSYVSRLFSLMRG